MVCSLTMAVVLGGWPMYDNHSVDQSVRSPGIVRSSLAEHATHDGGTYRYGAKHGRKVISEGRGGVQGGGFCPPLHKAHRFDLLVILPLLFRPHFFFFLLCLQRFSWCVFSCVDRRVRTRQSLMEDSEQLASLCALRLMSLRTT